MAVIRESGRAGATAGQIARILNRSRSTVSHYLWMLKKAGRVRQLTRDLWTVVDEEEPFKMGVEEFLALPLEKFVVLQRKALSLSKAKLDEAFNAGALHVAVADGRVVQTLSRPAGFLAEEVQALVKKLGRPVYTFSRPDMVEESPWTPVSGSDFYPTLRLWVGPTQWSGTRVFEEGPLFDADFDTGNPYITAFDEESLKPLFSVPPSFSYTMGFHLGQEYHYFTRRTRIGLKDRRGPSRSLLHEVRLVRSWKTSPLVPASPKRRAFTGRHLMRITPFRTILDPDRRETPIQLL